VEKSVLEVDISLEESLIKDSISESDSTSKEAYRLPTYSLSQPAYDSLLAV
jgi:hypothetical protein